MMRKCKLHPVAMAWKVSLQSIIASNWPPTWNRWSSSRGPSAIAELLVIIRLWHYCYSDQTMTLVIFDQWLVLKCMMFVNAQLVLSQGIGFKQRNAFQCCIPATSPWLLSHPCVKFDLHRSYKDDTAPDSFQSKFYEVCASYDNFDQIYTDG